MELIIILIIVLMYMLPAVAGAGDPPASFLGDIKPDTDWPDSPPDYDPSPEDPVSPPHPSFGDIYYETPYTPTSLRKVIIKNGLMYRFQSSPEDVTAEESTSFIALAENEVEDLLRLRTLRLWYGYGWKSLFDGSPDIQTFYPLFGYFPVANTYNDIELVSNLNFFYNDFSNAAFYGSGDYFSSTSKPIPKLYIANIEPSVQVLLSTELSPLLEDPCYTELLGEGVNIYTKNWLKCNVAFNKFPTEELGGEDYNFEELMAAELIPFLEQRETIFTDVPAGEIGEESFDMPKRYYDIAFQVPLADEFFTVTSSYNVYQPAYEDALQGIPLLSTPVIPNIYIIDFAGLVSSVLDPILYDPTYYDLVSLSPNLPDFPASGTEELVNLLDNFGYSNENLYINEWRTGIYNGLAADNLGPLAELYKELIFSGAYSSRYAALLEAYKFISPMWISLLLPRLDPAYSSGFQYALSTNRVSTEGGAEDVMYDPEVHLISDTQIALPAQKEFWEIKHGSGDIEYTNTQPIVIEKNEDFTFEINNTWNIEDWFRLYCVQELSDECLGYFRTLALSGLSLPLDIIEPADYLLNPPSEMVYDEDSIKPVPVGAAEQTDTTAYSLLTPSGEVWNNCSVAPGADFKSPLADVYEKYSSLIDGELRTYKQIIDGELAYSELLSYRVEKKDSATGDVLQNFFFPTSLLAHEYLDTQVQYGQLYDYSLYAYQFVIGNEYWYQSYDISEAEDEWVCPDGWVLTAVEMEDGTLEQMCIEASALEAAASVDDIDGLMGFTAANEVGYDPIVLFQNSYEPGIPSTGLEGDYCAGAARRMEIQNRIKWKLYENQHLSDVDGFDDDDNQMLGPLDEGYKLFANSSSPTNELVPKGRCFWRAAGRPTWMGHPMIIWNKGFATKHSTEGTWYFYTWNHIDAYKGFAEGFDWDPSIDHLGAAGMVWQHVEWLKNNTDSPSSVSDDESYFLYTAWKDYLRGNIGDVTLSDGTIIFHAAWSLPSNFEAGAGELHYNIFDFDDMSATSTIPATCLFPAYGGINPVGCCTINQVNIQVPDSDDNDAWVQAAMNQEFEGEDSGDCPETPVGQMFPPEYITSDTITYNVETHTRPYPLLIETKATSIPSLTTKIVDSPPVYPDADIVPYRSVKDKALLMINGNVGRYDDYPIIIEPNDVELFADVVIEHDIEMELDPEEVIRNVEDYLVTFGSDDYPKAFEIFRIDFPPTIYQDFALGRKLILDNTARDEIVVTANSTIDSILPNKKYWYTFRSVDAHNHVSNPSGIYQVEMVDTGNSIFPVIEMYPLPKGTASYTKPMRKYLLISPSAIQESKRTDIVSANDFAEDPTLGADAEETMWGKRYKLRITSKSTGKKVDINFSFKQESLDDTEL